MDINPQNISREFFPNRFQENARAAIDALAETLRTNERRAAAGHPGVPCQLTPEQAEALASMVNGLTTLLAIRDERRAK